MSQNKVTHYSQCPECKKVGDDNTGDNLAIYEDGSDYCFKCAYTNMKTDKKERLVYELLPIPARKLNGITCEKYGIGSGLYTGFIGYGVKKKYYNEEPVYVFNMTEGNEIYCQKLRAASDRGVCMQMGDTTKNKLFGQSLFSPNKKMPIIVTEGELDAATIYQETGYPAVSITNGSAGAAKQIAINIAWLSQWKHVTLCFDNDDAGIQATKKCIPHFEPGTVKVAKLQLKDANDMLIAGRGGELKKVMWDAEVVRPKTIITVKELGPRVLTKQPMGLAWPWPDLTTVTRGFRTKEIYVVTAATGVGKTELVKEMMFHLIDNGIKIGVFSFEQDPSSTMQRLIGNKLGHKLHDPNDDWWDEKAIKEQLEYFNNKIYLYDNRGSLPWEEIALNIRYMVKCYSIQCIILDNLTAMCSCPIVDGHRMKDFDYIAHVMGNLFSLVHELDVTFIVVAHLAKDKISRQAYVTTSPKNPAAYFSITPDKMDKMINKPGMEWDSGRIPSIGNIAGSDSVSRLADYVLGLARNRVSEDPIEHITTRVKVLKAGRIDSSLEGSIFNLYYDSKRGKLVDSIDYITREEESEDGE